MPNVPDPSAGILFLSDAHLGGFSADRNRRIEQSLTRLLDHCEEHGLRICILGDLFDYWMEYPDRGWAPDLASELLERFRAFNDPQQPTLYITGNHDCWTGPRLPSFGFEVEHGWREWTLGGRRVLLLHGDGRPDPDEGMRMHRPLLHRLLRNKTFVSWYQKLLAPKAGITLMKRFSRLTRGTDEGSRETRVLDRWAEPLLRQTGYDLVICGHDHRPRVRNFHFGTYINLGTFYKHRTLCLYTKGDFELVTWNDTENELRPYRPTSDE